jgi:molybdopterin synthase sulfur carrier subunit
VSSLVHVRLPAQLRILARVGPDVALAVTGPVTQRSVLSALEQDYPVLLGTIRDRTTAKRRPFIRFFAGEADLSNEAPDALLPDAIARGAEVFVVVGAMAGG